MVGERKKMEEEQERERETMKDKVDGLDLMWMG